MHTAVLMPLNALRKLSIPDLKTVKRGRSWKAAAEEKLLDKV